MKKLLAALLAAMAPVLIEKAASAAGKAIDKLGTPKPKG